MDEFNRPGHTPMPSASHQAQPASEEPEFTAPEKPKKSKLGGDGSKKTLLWVGVIVVLLIAVGALPLWTVVFAALGVVGVGQCGDGILLFRCG